MTNLRNIDTVIEPTHDEHSRQRFVSVLRKHILFDMGAAMKTVYDHAVEPRFEKQHGRKPKDGFEIRKEMLDEPIFQEYSALRHNAQLMSWWSVQPAIERKLPEMIEVAKEAAAKRPIGGTLRLNPAVDIPRTVSELDVHLMPGCFADEYVADDVAQGAVVHHGTKVFAGGLAHRQKGGWGATAARVIQIRHPDFKPKTYLDIGCTVGRELLSVMDYFPGMEVHGVDVGAPMLRYAHARAEAMGKKVHFSQQNGESLDFADNSFDLVTTSFFFHEISVKSSKKILREVLRVLKPGGLMINQEMIPSALVSPYQDFAGDWDGYYNNEPHVVAFRHQDLRALFVECGFAKDKYVQFRAPNYGTWPDGVFEAVIRGEMAPPEITHGSAWFSFGAWK